MYYDLQQPSGLYNVFVTTAGAGSPSFTTPVQLTNQPLQEFAPFGIDPFTGGNLAAATTGGVFAAWTDTRRGTAANGKEDIFFATTVAAVAGGTTPASGVSAGSQVPVPTTGGGLGIGGALLLTMGTVALSVTAASRTVRRR